ncbi:pseudouridylate synthase / pseudouridine kinase, partial [Tremellales sp. Uapishka_1]
MPFPTNLNTALSLESILRSQGCVPATVALMGGRVHVGLSRGQLDELGDPKNGKDSVKVSRRDLGPALAAKKNGGTTVAGTMVIAQSVGIRTFVTGGIGGVHRGAESSMDVSADLIELGRTPMAVICAGAKSILDIPRTLEVLETQGVCVATYGERSDFPAFYTPSSGQMSPWRVGDAQEAAELIYSSLSLPTPQSTLLAVPIPSEHLVPGLKVQEAVEQAILESVQQGIDKRGKEVTPWLLKRVGELTAGSALELNIKLIENNARVGGAVARRVESIFQEQKTRNASSSLYFSGTNLSSSSSSSSSLPSSAVSSPTAHSPSTSGLPSPRVLVFGSAALDITSTSTTALVPNTTTPGTIFLSPGGVARNIAEATQNLLAPHAVQLVAMIGQDSPGRLLKVEMEQTGLRTDGFVTVDQGARTAGCTLVLEGGDLVGGVADMEIVHLMTEKTIIESIQKHLPEMVVFDLNLSQDLIATLLQTAQALHIPTFCDPTSVPKLSKLIALLPTLTDPLTHIAPNLLELDMLHDALSEQDTWEYINDLNLLADFRSRMEKYTKAPCRKWIAEHGVIQKGIKLLPFVQELWVKAGKNGLLHMCIATKLPRLINDSALVHGLEGKLKGQHLVVRHWDAPKIDAADIVSTTGAGDTLVGGIVAGLVGNLGEEEAWMEAVMERVDRSLRSRRAVG